jgi:hypothetical protein
VSPSRRPSSLVVARRLSRGTREAGPDIALLRRALDETGYADVAIKVALVFGGARELPAGG